MPSPDAPGPVPIPSWRYLMITVLVTLLYVGMWLLAKLPTPHPAFLLTNVPPGAAIGVLTGRFEAAVAGDAAARHLGPGHSRSGRRHRGTSSLRWILTVLGAIAVVLIRALSEQGTIWMLYFMPAFMAGAGCHAWVMERHYKLATADQDDSD